MDVNSMNKKVKTTSFLFFLRVIFLLSFYALSSQSISTEFITVKCNTTEFPHLCVSSLSSYATFIGDSNIRMADAALNVALRTARSTSAGMARLSAGGAMSPREANAVRDCVEVLTDGVDHLRDSLRSMDRLRGPDILNVLNDVQTWVSAALTDDTTCMDGFAGRATNGRAESAMRNGLVMLARLTSNALALINSLATAGSEAP
ncbi:hypothetical protein HPP92_014581 [Vanilla planifolia]|uniref:pectinesterase n=1 Tax=Vanilla planifolia TaxID=51239 RepID=A0A835UWD0_VANPL|nr:hypothetical protein HPP92_014581 [Vanilla planifolia]